MDFINPNLIPTLALAVICSGVGNSLAKKEGKYPLWEIVFSLLTLPALSFIVYYFHWFEPGFFYIEFRAIPYVEVLTGFAALAIAYFPKKYLLAMFQYGIVNAMIAICFVMIPFMKPILSPILRVLEDDWKDGVCMQSCGSTCGPSSLATIYKYYDISQTEQAIAEKSFSCASSTEIWYLIRYARQHHLQVKCEKIQGIETVTVPAILGTIVGTTSGHFVTLLGKEGEYYFIGDPLRGKVKLTATEFNEFYQLRPTAFIFYREFGD